MKKEILVLEGPDGSGKSLHSDILNSNINLLGIKSSVYHHSKPILNNSYQDYFLQRKRVFNDFLGSDNSILVLDRNIYSSILFSSIQHIDLLSGDFRVCDYQKEKEIEEEILFLDSIKEHITTHILILHADNNTLNKRLEKRGEEITEDDQKKRIVYENRDLIIKLLFSIYEIQENSGYIKFLGEEKEVFGKRILNYFIPKSHILSKQ